MAAGASEQGKAAAAAAAAAELFRLRPRVVVFSVSAVRRIGVFVGEFSPLSRLLLLFC
jgi:hypothetical protein